MAFNPQSTISNKPGRAWLWVIVVVLLLLALFAGTVFNYWRQIKSGNAGALNEKFYGNIHNNNIEAVSSKRLELEAADAPVIGNPVAPITIVEFVDFKCPNCLSSYPVMKQVLQKYSKEAKLIVRQFPIEDLNPGARQLAELALCANEQKHFWEMHDVLFFESNNLDENLTTADISRLSAKAGTDLDKLITCLNNGSTRNRVNTDMALGVKYGVAGTPIFFVNGNKVEGHMPIGVWDDFFQRYQNAQ